MEPEEMKLRTKRFALSIFKFVETLPNSKTCSVISNQLLRSSTSIGANYKAACRAKSKSDFIYKLSIVEEESDETIYWLELLAESGINNQQLLTPLMKEAGEITAIIVSSIKTAKNKTK